jgi:hypothetical protein
MKILIQKPDRKPTRILLPTGLLFNATTATLSSGIIRGKAKRHGVSDEDLQMLTAKNMRRLFRELHRAKKQLKRLDLPLVEVSNPDGEQIEITL